MGLFVTVDSNAHTSLSHRVNSGWAAGVWEYIERIGLPCGPGGRRDGRRLYTRFSSGVNKVFEKFSELLVIVDR